MTSLTLTIEVTEKDLTKLFKGKSRSAKNAVMADLDFQRALAEDMLWAWKQTLSEDGLSEPEPFDQSEVLYGLVPEKFHAQLKIDC